MIGVQNQLEILNYKIDHQTIYVKCLERRGFYSSKVLKVNGDTVDVPNSPNKLISDNCKLYSQSYVSRKELTKLLTGVSSKTPIILDFFGTHTFFCTHSDRVAHNEWFNLRHIKTYEPHKGMTRVTFSNNEIVMVDISHRSFNNQYLNALRLNYMFTLEMNEYNTKKRQPGNLDFAAVDVSIKHNS